MRKSDILLCPVVILMLLSLMGVAYPGPDTAKMYDEAAALAHNGHIDDAIKRFLEVIEASPCYSLGHYGLGKAYLYKDGACDDAITHLKLSVHYDRRLAKGHFYLGMAYMLKRQYTQSIGSFKTAYAIDPGIVESLYNIAVIYDITGRRGRAEWYYNKYVDEKNKKDTDILF